MTSPTDRPLRLDLVVRTSKRKKEARSPQQQRDMAEACAALPGNSYVIAAVHDSERSESGKTMERASLAAAMARVHAGQTDGIIVALTDRVGRAPIEESMAWVRQLDKVGVLVLADAGGQPVNLADPQAETMLVIQLQFARQVWLGTAKRFRQSQADAVARGAFIGRCPIGYLRPVKGQPLVVDEAMAPTVREAFRLAATDGMHAAMAYLTEHVPTRLVKREGEMVEVPCRWRTDEVRKLLRSKLYLGVIEYGDLVNPRAHPALVSRDVWTAAQTEPQARRTNGHYVLSGVVRCAVCKTPMGGHNQTVRGRQYPRLRCNACGATSISHGTLLETVRDLVREALQDATIVERFTAPDVTEAREALERAEDERASFATDLGWIRDLGRDAARANAAALAAAVDEARERYATVVSTAARVESIPVADELDDDDALLAAVRALDVAFLVRPGRGEVLDRLQFVHESDLDARPAATFGESLQRAAA